MFESVTMYKRIRLGRASKYLSECLDGGFVGLDFDLNVDLTGRFPSTFQEFNAEFVPILVEQNPELSRVSAGLGCASIFFLCHELSEGDVVLTPDEEGNQLVGRVNGPYVYAPG